MIESGLSDLNMKLKKCLMMKLKWKIVDIVKKILELDKIKKDKDLK